MDHRLDCQEFPLKVNFFKFTYILSSDRNNLVILPGSHVSVWTLHVDFTMWTNSSGYLSFFATPKVSFICFANKFRKQNKYIYTNSYSNLCILSELAGFSNHVYSRGFSIIFVAVAKCIKSHCSLSSQNNNKSPQSHLGLIKWKRK